jgi:hypothetical protein
MVIIARQWTLCVLRDLVEQQHMWLTFGKHLIRIWSETACIHSPLHASVLHANTWFMCVCVCVGGGDSCNCIGAVMEFRSLTRVMMIRWVFVSLRFDLNLWPLVTSPCLICWRNQHCSRVSFVTVSTYVGLGHDVTTPPFRAWCT